MLPFHDIESQRQLIADRHEAMRRAARDGRLRRDQRRRRRARVRPDPDR